MPELQGIWGVWHLFKALKHGETLAEGLEVFLQGAFQQLELILGKPLNLQQKRAH